jgi:F-type H+-transporting ATPase subunit gamma
MGISLPLDNASYGKLAATPWPSTLIPQGIDGVPSALKAMLSGYHFVLLFRAWAESLASENASRLGSMQRAEKNIDSMLQDLNRKFHRLRQEAIHEEHFDGIAEFDGPHDKASLQESLLNGRPQIAPRRHTTNPTDASKEGP